MCEIKWACVLQKGAKQSGGDIKKLAQHTERVQAIIPKENPAAFETVEHLQVIDASPSRERNGERKSARAREREKRSDCELERESEREREKDRERAPHGASATIIPKESAVVFDTVEHLQVFRDIFFAGASNVGVCESYYTAF